MMTPVMRGFLWGVTTSDPLTLAAMVVTLGMWRSLRAICPVAAR